MPIQIALVLALLAAIFILLFRQKSGQKDFLTLKMLQDALIQGLQETRSQVRDALTNHTEETGKRLERLTLTNGKRADCILFLPPPSGSVIIDAKFPLETFRQITDETLPESDRKSAEQRFRMDIRRHIQDIAEKYILPPETADGAVMFIPAERSEEHTSELQSQSNLVCRLLLEKKKIKNK